MLRRGTAARWSLAVILVLLGLGCSLSWVAADADTLSAAGGSGGNAEAVKQAEQLDMLADSLYQHVLEGNINLVRQEILQASDIFEHSSFQGLTSVEGFHALSESLVEMKEATNQAQIQQEQWQTASAKFRLAADSLSHPKQPMWMQYYKVLREDLSEMKARAAAADSRGMKAAYESLQNHYEIIRPAVIIQRKPEEITAADAWVSYAGGLVQSSSSSAAEIQNVVTSGEEVFNGLFGKKKDDNPAFAPIDEVNGLWPWTFWAGSFIILILTYTGYRKYKGERDSFKSVKPKDL